MNKRGGFTDIFLFMIFSFVILFISGIMIYIGATTYTELKDKFAELDLGINETLTGYNSTTTIDNTIGVVNNSYKALYWLSVLIILGMAFSIFIGSYMVTTKPIFFVPYLFIIFIAIVVSVFISNVYGDLIETPELASSFEGFIGANFIMGYLPIWVTIIAFVGGMIMFSRMGSKENQIYGGNYG